MGEWYRAGTVSVTNGSPNVVGVGTLWNSQASPGDIFLGPNLVEHEIVAIADDTHITVRQVDGTDAYAGVTASAQPYAIIRNFTSTLPAQLASRLAELMTTYHVTLDELTAWLSGTGTVTVHDAVGNSYSVQTPAAMNAVLSGRLVKSVAGGVDVTLTTAEAANLFIELTGTLTANINLILPAGVRHNFILNNTSGAFTVTVKTAAGAGVAVMQGKRGLLECDGTNVVSAQSQLDSVKLTGTTQVEALAASGLATLNGNVVMGDASTDTVTVNGYMGVGGAPVSSYALSVSSSALSGTVQIGGAFTPTATNAATGDVRAVYTRPNTAEAAFTCGAAYGLFAAAAVSGAGSAITNVHGVYVADQTAGTNNYGITSAVSSGTNKWNLYASGTAANWLRGNLSVGVNTSTGGYQIGANDGTTTVAVGAAGGVAYVGSVAGGPLAVIVNNSEKFRVHPSGGISFGHTADPGAGNVAVAGRVGPSAHNNYDLGTTAVRWKDLWLQSAAFNGSDARLKTPVSAMTAAEIAASKQIAAEIGTYQWLESVAIKGAAARLHIGLTVQRAIEIMTANGLDWTRYGFIGYDQWDDVFVDHPEVPAIMEVTDEAGNVVTPAVEFQAAWTEQTQAAGDAYSFRYAELNQFIAAGFNARIAAIEASLAL